jgi:hypothetical protein
MTSIGPTAWRCFDALLSAHRPSPLTDLQVRKVYDRTAFERAWLSATGGIVYVIHPASVPLPPVPAGQLPNW